MSKDRQFFEYLSIISGKTDAYEDSVINLPNIPSVNRYQLFDRRIIDFRKQKSMRRVFPERDTTILLHLFGSTLRNL